MSNSRTKSYAGFQQDAEAIEAGYRAALEALRLREDLSQKGKADEKAKLDAERRNRVERLQGVAATAAKLDREFYAEELRKAKTAEVARLRRVLGDTVLADVYARRLSAMSAQAVLDWHASAVDEWEATIVAQLGAAVLSGRKAKNDFEAQQNAEAVQRLLALPQDVVEIEEALAQLRDTETFVQRLDVRAYYEDIAPRLGVKADYMPLPNAPADVKPLRLPDERMQPRGFAAFFEAPGAATPDTPQAQPAK